MADWNYRISPNITLGAYSTARLGQLAKEFGNRFMLMLDPVFKEFGVYDKITAPLKERGVEYFIFDEITAFPVSGVVERARDLAKKSHIQGVIACGGSKTLIAAKCVCALFQEEKTISDFFDGLSITKPSLPLVALPSTPKDSFIFMNKMPLVDARTRQLKVLTVQNAICKLAIFDPNLCSTLSKKQMLSLSLEVLCMAIEAQFSAGGSFFSDMLSDKALEMFFETGVTQQLDATPDETLLAQCGALTSLAVATTGLGVASLLALAVNAKFGVSRSLVCAILLPYVLDKSSDFAKEKVQHIKDLLHIKQENSLPDDIRQRIALANLPARLKDLSLSIEQLTSAAEDALSLEFARNLSAGFSGDDLFELIKKAF